MSAYNPPQALPQFDISSFSMTPSTGGSAYPPPSLDLPVFDKSSFPAETTAVEATVPASFTNTQIGTGTLNTNNIQPLTAADVNLYTTITSGVINLGSSILAQLKIYSAWVQIFSPVYYFYNPASTQLWSTRFYPATNAITTLFFADATSTQPSVSLQSKPTTAGDATGLNGWYSMVSGTISMGCQIKTSLEAPLHYLYNYAKTMYKQTSYGATSMIGLYYADPVNTAVVSSTITNYSLASLIANSGSWVLQTGSSKIFASLFTQFNAPYHAFYNFAGTMHTSEGFAATFAYTDTFADTANQTIKSSVIVVTPSTTTPTVDYTGAYEIRAGNIDLNAGTLIKAGAPIIPDYIPSYTLLHGVNTVGAIGYTYSGVQSIAPLTLIVSNSGTTYFTPLTGIPAGVWIVSAACAYDVILATNISRQYLGISTGLTIPNHQNIIISSPTGNSPTSQSQLGFTCVVTSIVAWNCGCSISLTFSVVGAIRIPTAPLNNTSYFRITRLA